MVLCLLFFFLTREKLYSLLFFPLLFFFTIIIMMLFLSAHRALSSWWCSKWRWSSLACFSSLHHLSYFVDKHPYTSWWWSCHEHMKSQERDTRVSLSLSLSSPPKPWLDPFTSWSRDPFFFWSLRTTASVIFVCFSDCREYEKTCIRNLLWFLPFLLCTSFC